MREIKDEYEDIEMDTIHLVSQTFKALGEPTRIRILHLLALKECSVNEISETLELKQSTVSHQLRLLKSLRLVKSRREGTSKFYSYDDEHVIEILEQMIEHVAHQ